MRPMRTLDGARIFAEFEKAITSQLAQIIYKMQSEMAAFSILSDIYIENTNANRR